MPNNKSVSAQLDDIMETVKKRVDGATDRAITQTAKESAQKLKNTSPKRTGDYAKGWRVKKRGKHDQIVYNATNYQLTHLLENGHVIRNKKGTYGRTTGDHHISDVEKEAIQVLPRRIMEDI